MIYHKDFKKGPFNLKAFSRPVAVVACAWIAFITIIFCLPELNPVNSQTLNYTPVAVGIIAFFSFGSWFVWAHRWFTGMRTAGDFAGILLTFYTGPIRQIEAAEAGIDVEDPGALEEAEAQGRIHSTGDVKRDMQEHGDRSLLAEAKT